MSETSCENCQRMQAALEQKDKQIHDLEGEKTRLAYDLKEMRDKWFSRKKKREEAVQEQKTPKKRGAPKGHAGWFRRRPAKIDVTEEVTLTVCPSCGGGDLTDLNKVEEHVQEDIVIPTVRVTCYRRHSYRCNTCKADVAAGLGTDEMANSFIGPTAKAFATFLKYVVKVSQRDIQKTFKEFFNLTIVPSSVPGFHNQLRRKALPLYEALKQEIKKAPYIQGDETSAPLNGENHWDWVFATAKICLHAIRQSRGQKVVEELLGKRYEGILVSDFLSAYNKIDVRARQRCLVHLLRDLKKALACSEPGDPIHLWCQRLKDTLQKAIDLSRRLEANTIALTDFELARQQIKESLPDFQFADPQKGILGRLSKRLVRHGNELFTFLDYPGVPFHNNHVEQLIRAGVLLRKITFGNRSPQGQLNHEVLMSLTQTARLNGKDPIALFQKILTTATPPALGWCLGP